MYEQELNGGRRKRKEASFDISVINLNWIKIPSPYYSSSLILSTDWKCIFNHEIWAFQEQIRFLHTKIYKIQRQINFNHAVMLCNRTFTKQNYKIEYENGVFNRHATVEVLCTSKIWEKASASVSVRIRKEALQFVVITFFGSRSWQKWIYLASVGGTIFRYHCSTKHFNIVQCALFLLYLVCLTLCSLKKCVCMLQKQQQIHRLMWFASSLLFSLFYNVCALLKTFCFLFRSVLFSRWVSLCVYFFLFSEFQAQTYKAIVHSKGN